MSPEQVAYAWESPCITCAAGDHHPAGTRICRRAPGLIIRPTSSVRHVGGANGIKHGQAAAAFRDGGLEKASIGAAREAGGGL